MDNQIFPLVLTFKDHHFISKYNQIKLFCFICIFFSSGGITFDQFLLYELFGEIPDIDDHGLEAIYDPIAGKVIKESAKHARNACAIM